MTWYIVVETDKKSSFRRVNIHFKMFNVAPHLFPKKKKFIVVIDIYLGPLWHILTLEIQFDMPYFNMRYFDMH